MHDLGFQGKNELNCAEFKIMRYVLRLKVVNI
jgi:hypothetical protein